MSGKADKRERQILEAVLRGINPSGSPDDLAERLRLVPPEEWAWRAEAYLARELVQIAFSAIRPEGRHMANALAQMILLSLRSGMVVGALDPAWAQRVLVGSARHQDGDDPKRPQQIAIAKNAELRRAQLQHLHVVPLTNEDWPTIYAATRGTDQTEEPAA